MNSLRITSAGAVGIGNTAPGSLLDLGLAGTTTGTLRLEGKTSGYVQLSPSAAAGSWTMTLPTGVPASNGYVLSSTTAGVTSWVANGGGGASNLSSITSAIATNSIDNAGNAQTWTWNSLTTQTAFTLSSSSLTNGKILSLQNTAAAATATGHVLDISNTTTGAGYGVYSAMTSHGNTGFAGYFSNTDTSSNVNYGIYATVSGANAWAGYFNGNIYLNGTITMSSDRSLKNDIEPLDTEDALDDIAALRPVAFTWKKTGVPDMGLIAQEVEPVFPLLVTSGGADETIALKYTSLIAPVIASIQELKKRNDEIENENAALRRDFEAYKASHP